MVLALFILFTEDHTYFLLWPVCQKYIFFAIKCP
jgi:hypothetical protein